MSGPARAGLFIYAKDRQRLAQFYKSILGMSQPHASTELVVLQSPDLQLVIHQVPESIASSIVITSPPQRRDVSLKFFFTVPSLVAARSAAQELGGEVFSEQWQGPGFVVCNACDPEGNVFHVRENVA